MCTTSHTSGTYMSLAVLRSIQSYKISFIFKSMVVSICVYNFRLGVFMV